MMLNSEIEREIGNLIGQKDYPCLAAVKSFQRKDFEFKTFKDFGRCDQRKDLRCDLLKYLKEYLETKSPFSTFWAIFPESLETHSSQEFNQLVRNELAALTSSDTNEIDRDPRLSQITQDENHFFSLWGHAFTVIGLNPKDKDPNRCFPFPALVFNVYDQYEQCSRSGWTHISHLPLIAKEKAKKVITIPSVAAPLVTSALSSPRPAANYFLKRSVRSSSASTSLNP